MIGSAALASAAAWPLLRVRAGGRTKRLVIVYAPQGATMPDWRPTSSSGGLRFAPGSILEPLAAHASKITVVDGLRLEEASNHQPGMMQVLTGGVGKTGGRVSVDQVIASGLHGSPAVRGGAAPRSLQLGVYSVTAWGVTANTCATYATDGTLLAPDDDPQSAARRLFGAASPSDPTVPDRAAVRRRAVLDALAGDVTALRRRAPPRVDRQLQVHAESIAAAGTATGPILSASCDPMEPSTPDPTNPANMPDVGRAQINVLVSALACDLVDVATLQWAGTDKVFSMSWLGQSQDFHNQVAHGVSNEPGRAGTPEYVAGLRWFSEQFAYLLSVMEATPDPSGAGSVLDESLVVSISDLGHPNLHNCIEVPVLIAGGGSGLHTGNRWLRAEGRNHNELWLAIARAMGVSGGVGDPRFASAPLPGLLSI